MELIDTAGLVLALFGSLNLTIAVLGIAFSRPFSRPLGGERRGGVPAPQPRDRRGVQAGKTPFISVHLATHDEPPEIVIATIEALTRLDYPAFEIIVIDNNTPDPRTWLPVALRALQLGSRVRFAHREGVQGAKAGALNIALEMTDPCAEYVAIVDADYQVEPQFLRRAMAAFRPGIAFVQFPQAYRHAAAARPVTSELSDYFQIFPRAANRAQASLLTGTLSVIATQALRKVGGWPTGSITEDAELGVRLWSCGAAGLFISEEVGHGLLPLDLAGLRLQRQRWVSGNVQTLIAARRTLLRARGGAIEVLAQLTAWTGFLALPLLSLMLVAVLRLAVNDLPETWRIVEALGAVTLMAVLGAHLARALVRQRPASIAVTLALLWSSSFAWLGALTGRRLRFRRTPKGVGADSQRRRTLSVDTVAGLAALAAAGVFAADGALATATVLAASAGGLASAPLVDAWLRRAALPLKEHPCAA